MTVRKIVEVGVFINTHTNTTQTLFTGEDSKTKRDVIFYIAEGSRVFITPSNWLKRWQRV